MNPTYWVILEDRKESSQTTRLPRRSLIVQLCDQPSNFRVCLIEHPMVFEKVRCVDCRY